jgi:AhpD family alkylhydroperoxidase
LKLWYQRGSDLGDAFAEYYKKITENNALDKKTAELISLSVASILRCTHCTQIHIKKAKAVGATSKEITEALLLSSLVAASTQLFWDRDNFDKNIVD